MALHSYIRSLEANRVKAEEDRRCEEAKLRRADPRLMANWKPLIQQITEIWQKLPCDLQARPILISELIPQLTGKYNAHPSAGDVGQALRSLNFIPARDWRSSRRRWLPGPDTFR
jgi:hypothetical protein